MALPIASSRNRVLVRKCVCLRLCILANALVQDTLVRICKPMVRDQFLLAATPQSNRNCVSRFWWHFWWHFVPKNLASVCNCMRALLFHKAFSNRNLCATVRLGAIWRREAQIGLKNPQT